MYRSGYISIMGSNIELGRLLCRNLSKAEPKACDYEISIDLVSFGVDTATRDGKKIANEIADYLSNAGYNVSISSGDNRASLIIDLSATKYLEED